MYRPDSLVVDRDRRQLNVRCCWRARRREPVVADRRGRDDVDLGGRARTGRRRAGAGARYRAGIVIHRRLDVTDKTTAAAAAR